MFLRRSFAVFPRQRRFIRMNERIPELFRQKLRMTSSIRMVRFLNSAWAGGSNGTPNGIRTRVARMKTWCPGPLDDRGRLREKRKMLCNKDGTPNGIRTRVARMRTWCPGPLDDRGKSNSVCHANERWEWHPQRDSNPCRQDENLVS